MMKTRIKTLLTTKYEENEKLNHERYKQLSSKNNEGLGKEFDTTLALKAFARDKKNKTAKIQDVEELLNLAKEIHKNHLEGIAVYNKEVKKAQARYVYCLANICHKNDQANQEITLLAEDKLRKFLKDISEYQEEYQILHQKLLDRTPIIPKSDTLQINTKQLEPLSVEVELQSINQSHSNAATTTAKSSISEESKNINSIISTNTNKTSALESKSVSSPPQKIVTFQDKAEEMRKKAQDIVIKMLEDMSRASLEKTDKKNYFINALQLPLIHKSANFAKSPNASEESRLGLIVLETLSNYMNEIQLGKQDENSHHFEEIRRERWNYFGGGNTDTWQEMRTAVKQEMLTRLKASSSKELDPSDYDRYSSVFTQHSGRSYARGFCGLWTKTNSLREFEHHFKKAPVDPSQQLQIQIELK